MCSEFCVMSCLFQSEGEQQLLGLAHEGESTCLPLFENFTTMNIDF